MIDILLIEDDPDVADNLQEYLVNQSKGEWRIHISDNGTDGLELATQTVYFIILLDIGLPEHNGFEICRKLRRMGIQTPIIFITGRFSETDVLKGYECGGDDYLIKPFSMAQLAAKIKVFLRRYGIECPDKVSYLDLTANRNERKVYLNDTALLLQPKEFDILLYLMEHSERLVSREELIVCIWGSESDMLPRNLDNHIKNIRKQLESSIARIVTQHGYGYRMEKNDKE